MNVLTQKTAEYTTLSGTINNITVKKIDGIRLILGNHLSVTDKTEITHSKMLIAENTF